MNEDLNDEQKYIKKLANELEKRNKVSSSMHQLISIIVLVAMCFAIAFLFSYGWHIAKIIANNKFGG